MPRKPRVVAAGVPHHVTQRGNNRQDIFLVDDDRRFYLAALAENKQRYGLRVLGYCLMTNHVHLVVVPEHADSLRLALQRTQSHYAQHFNRRYSRTGHLWQGRFFSCPLDRNHLATALAYVDLNPVRAHVVGRADHYPWSSAAAHIAGDDPGGMLDLELWREIPSAPHWADSLQAPSDEQDRQHLRQATLAGLPLGESTFVAALEQALARRLTPARPGRPKNAAAAA